MTLKIIINSHTPVHKEKTNSSMETKIQAIHFEATTQLVDFINKKVEKLVRKNPAIADAAVNLRVVKPETSLEESFSWNLDIFITSWKLLKLLVR